MDPLMGMMVEEKQKRIETTQLDQIFGNFGFNHIGGLTNRVYLNQQRGEILKLGYVDDPAVARD